MERINHKTRLLGFFLLATSSLSVAQTQTTTQAPELLYALIVLLFASLVFVSFKWSMARKQLQTCTQQMQVQSRTDELTQMLNRKYMEKRLFEVFELHLRQQEVRDVLVMIDVDEFKKVNVTHGHAAGDWVLQSLSRLVIERFRTTDLCGRYAEDGFLVLVRDSGMENARRVAEELRKKIASTVISYQEENIQVSCSIGLSAYAKDMISCHDWIQQADMAAYQAKLKGGNQTVA